MRKIAFILIAAFIASLLASCGTSSEYVTDSSFALDTLVSFKVAGQENASENIADCMNMIDRLDGVLSKTNRQSDISKLNASAEAVLTPEGYETLKLACRLSLDTDGAYDPTVGEIVGLWDITGNARVPRDDELARAMTHVGADKLIFDDVTNTVKKTDPETIVDLGGAGKGYVCQKAVELLASKGGYGVVSFGSSIGVFGAKPDGSCWNIAITDPSDPSSTIGYVTVPNGFISVSGDYERYAEIDGKRYCHIIDPATGRPVDNGVHSVVVWNGDGEAGDVISTALFVCGEDGVETLRGAGLEFEAMIISDAGTFMTDGMKKIYTEYGK